MADNELSKYKLYIFKKTGAKLGNLPKIFFAVVDAEKGETFPESFVCNLPCDFSDFETTSFQNIFKTIPDQTKFALQLLNEAKTNPDYKSDPDIVAEINKRQVILRTPPSPKKKGWHYT